jgi:hypothetical protein
MSAFAKLAAWMVLASAVSYSQSAVDLSGKVTESSTGAPLAGVTVEVRVYGSRPPEDVAGEAPLPHPPPVLTGVSGAFRFSGLPPGNFQIQASRQQFQTRTEVFESDPGEKAIEVRLARLGIVTGIVTDSAGQPLHGVTVVLFQTPVVDGRRTIVPSLTTATDDHGHYRLADIAPGNYLLEAVAPAADSTTSFVPVFFGGSTDWKSAAPIACGERDVSADIKLTLQPSRKIRGKLTGATAFRNASFEVLDQQGNRVAARASLVGSGGDFQIAGIVSRSYTVRVKLGDVFGEAEVTIGESDAEGLEIPLRPAVNVRVTSDCGLKLANEQGTLCGDLTLDGPGGQRITLTRYRPTPVPTGSYRFKALASSMYVESVLVSGQVVRPGEKLRIEEGMDPVMIKAGQNGGSIDVKLEVPPEVDASDLVFLMVPVGESYSGPALIPLNTAQLTRLAPGDYVIYTLHSSDMQQVEYRNPDALRALVPSANVTIEGFGHQAISIRNLSK